MYNATAYSRVTLIFEKRSIVYLIFFSLEYNPENGRYRNVVLMQVLWRIRNMCRIQNILVFNTICQTVELYPFNQRRDFSGYFFPDKPYM